MRTPHRSARPMARADAGPARRAMPAETGHLGEGSSGGRHERQTRHAAMQLVGGRVVGELESHHAAHRVPDHQRVLDVEGVEHRPDVLGHAADGRASPPGREPCGHRRATRRRDPGVPAMEKPADPATDDPWPRRSGAMTRWCRRQVAQLMGPQRPAQHEPVQQHDRWPLAALDDVDGDPRRPRRRRVGAVVGHGEALRRDVVGGGARARHQAVLCRPSRCQRGAGPGGHTAHEPAPVQRSLVAHR